MSLVRGLRCHSYCLALIHSRLRMGQSGGICALLAMPLAVRMKHDRFRSGDGLLGAAAIMITRPVS